MGVDVVRPADEQDRLTADQRVGDQGFALQRLELLLGLDRVQAAKVAPW